MISKSKGIISGLPEERVQSKEKAQDPMRRDINIEMLRMLSQRRKSGMCGHVKKSKNEEFQEERSSQPCQKFWFLKKQKTKKQRIKNEEYKSIETLTIIPTHISQS